MAVDLPSAFRSLLRSRRGNFAAITAIAAMPVLLSVGVAVDSGRYMAAVQHAQELVDVVALAAASSPERGKDKLREVAESFFEANRSGRHVANLSIGKFEVTENVIEIHLNGTFEPTFMGMAGYHKLPLSVNAFAERAMAKGKVEVALVLDNTWSMSEKDPAGNSKIGTLKTAAANLVNELLEAKDGDIKIGLVPFADYVNVGTKYRGASWLSVGDDYSVTTERTCETRTTRTYCLQTAPTYSCTTTVDGVVEPATCGGGCTKSETREVEPYQYCTGGGTTHYKWYGCVGSRMTGTSRLNDSEPAVPYPGYLATSQRCLNPLVTLTKEKPALLKAISGMIINIGSYKPYTYLPAGLTWGWNMLSPSDPLKEGAAYDPDNIEPRKVLVLMTDGENTLRFRASDGRHVSFSGTAGQQATQLSTVNKETLTICTNMKAQKIEIFAVAFMVDDGASKSLLKACATDPQHYYDATDSAKLLAAFGGIAQSLRVVRLTN